MELALYMPGAGYYEQERPIGRRGDFYTSVSVGSLFGRLLARKFAAWLEASPQTAICLAEVGAHQGDLARDVLEWFRTEKPDLYSRLQYTIIEPSPARQQWQAQRLGDFAGKVLWRETLPSPATMEGILFSNELLDAMPFDRLRWNAANRFWEEWRVDWAGERFAWVVAPLRAGLEALAPGVAPELKINPRERTGQTDGKTLPQTRADRDGQGSLLHHDYILIHHWRQYIRAGGIHRAAH